MAFERSLNVTVLPEFAQSEGAARVLDNLAERAAITAITTSPYVMEPSDAPDASREPPADAGAGHVRLLERDLFGERALSVRTSPSFVPNAALYDGLRYQPQPADELTMREGGHVADFIDKARERGIKAYLQVQAAIPPGYRVQFGGPRQDDRCLLPDGEAYEGRVDKNGSLASPHIKAYGVALIRDLAQAYPNMDGIRIDWPEYPPYVLDSLIFDFSPHAEAAAERLGYDIELMRRDATRLRDDIADKLNDGHLSGPSSASLDGLLDWLEPYPGFLKLCRFRSDLVVELIGAYQHAIDDASGGRMTLVPQGFPPPWSRLSGFDVRRLAPMCGEICVKLYTMHWPMIVRNYVERMLAINPELSPTVLLAAVYRILDLVDDPPPVHLDQIQYPAPDVPHPAGPKAQTRKIDDVTKLAGGVPVIPVSHAYGPIDDFRSRMETAWRASGGRMVVNRYGYMSDEKLDTLGDVTAEVMA